MFMRQLFDPATSTYSYLLADPKTGDAVLIDPVKEQSGRDARLIEELGFTLRYTLETHVHADHVTGGGRLRALLGSKTVVSARGGAKWVDVEVDEGSTISFGNETLEVRATPGHTDGCVTYVTADQANAFTGDAVMVRGCGRTDFQQGDARTLYRSVQERVFTLADDTKIWPGHDYKGFTHSTVGEEKVHNPRLSKDEEEFVRLMGDLKLSPPARIDVAVPANLICGIDPQDARI